ncbi:hypothetical protein BDV96DRAFT_213105 [Lophiotrema nucula]|uniref:Uncharacterized protein n=1 Tax=Lophiotrema nucula TaxID=690887 RepID=A0A6A5ZT15_9PLEO|nr:hypothetical protein BDV96DRAFT_213105 [Lophiotrema nucula]
MPLVRTIKGRDDSIAVKPGLPLLPDASPTSTPTSTPGEDSVQDFPNTTSTLGEHPFLPSGSPSTLPSAYPDRPALNPYRPPSKMPHLGPGWNRAYHSLAEIPDSWRGREFSIDKPVWSNRIGIKGLYIVASMWIGWLLVVWIKGNLYSLNEWLWRRSYDKERRRLRKEREDDSEWEKAYRTCLMEEEARRVEQRIGTPGLGYAEGAGERRSIEPAFSAPSDAGKALSVSVRRV